jgi:hypothetical protein
MARHVLARDLARALDPIELARDCGIEPDDVQARLLTSTAKRMLVNCCRQWGKSTVTGLIALHEAIYNAPAMIVLVSPSQNQSTELFRKIHDFWQALSSAPEANQESLTRMSLENGSRIISLPGSERTTRGYSGATLVVMDEAARVDDTLLSAVRPMLATTNGRFFALSTPAGKRGFFYEAWEHGEGWERISVKGSECPRISPEFLTEEMEALGPLRFSEEYECIFTDAETSVFGAELIEACFVTDFEPFILAAAA